MARRKVTKTSTKDSTKTAKKSVSADVMALSMVHAGKSGVALKKSTVEAAGVYPIVNKENGASLATRMAVYALVVSGKIKSPNAKVKPEMLVEVMNAPEFVPVTAKITELLGKEWRNFGKLKGCIAKEARDGTINAFQVDFDAKDDFKELKSNLKAFK